MKKQTNKIINIYKQHPVLIPLLFFIILITPQIAYINLHILKNKLSYLLLFLICGFLIRLTANLYKKEDFIKNIRNYIFIILTLDIVLTFIFIILALGGKQGTYYLNLLSLMPGEHFLYSISSKFTAVSAVFYSFWLLIYMFLSEDFFRKKQIIKNKIVMYKRLIYTGYLLVLFYPALHYYFFNSKILLKQFMM